MGRINNLDEDPMVEVMRRLTALERAAPVGFTEISRGALIVSSIAGLVVRGSAAVTGVLNGIGQLLWSGIVTLSGTVNISGPLGVTGTATVAGPLIVNGTANITGPSTTISGPFHVSGNTDISGAVEITGPSTSINGSWHLNGDGDIAGDVAVTGDVSLAGAGKILVGSMEISTQAGGYGQLQSPTTVHLNAPFVIAAGVFTALGNVNVGGVLANTGMPLKAGAVANVHIDVNGKLWRTS